MLLAHTLQRRQDVSLSESPSPPTSPYISTAYYNPLFNKPTPVPSALDLNYTFPTSDSIYLDSRQSTPSDHFNFGLSDVQYANSNTSHCPQFPVQPQPHGLPSATTPPPMIEENDLSQSAWNTYPDSSYLSPRPHQSYNPLAYRSTHKRVSSASSIGSTGPDSPYTQSSSYPQIVDPETQSVQSAHLESFDGSFSNVGNFPKPTYQAPAPLSNEQFFSPTFQNINPGANNAVSIMPAHNAMRQAMSQQQGSKISGGQRTPRQSFGGDVNATTEMRSHTPMLDRTMSDIYQDELYNPNLASSSQSSQAFQTPQQSNLLSPSSAAFSDLIQAANQGHISARSASPGKHFSSRSSLSSFTSWATSHGILRCFQTPVTLTTFYDIFRGAMLTLRTGLVTSAARNQSPFRPESAEYTTGGFSQSNPSSPATRLSSAAQIRQQQKMESDAQAFAQHHPQPRHDFVIPPKTISPKEAMLDYHETEEDVKMPLIASEKRDPQFSSANLNGGQLTRGSTGDNSNEQSFNSMATSRRQSSSNYSEPSSQQQSGSSYTFIPSSVPGMAQQYPFVSQSRRQSSSMRSGSDQIPEFPVSLPSMESTRSDAGQAENVRITNDAESRMRSPPSSAESIIQRPAHTAADSGSYTCVAQGCHARFDVASKLQKHRREAHRSSPRASTPTTPLSATTSNNTQATANNGSRNSAPGPHKCDKVNPTSGKPCNTVFSRSYDLTRHEDTIHNNRKQKVRCHLCTEEKTFSRNDALTRHMRVVHPDVEFPGKTRRGRNSEGADVVRQKIEGRRG